MIPQIDTEDERCGLPSASSAERTFACPGWVNLAAKVRDVKMPESKDAADGTLGHDVLAGELDEEDLDGREDIAHAVNVCNERLQSLIESLEFENPDFVLTEERLFLHNDKGDPIASGEFDKAIFKGRRVLIPDYKLGRKDQIPPANNRQLLTYALLLQEEYDFDEAILAIIPAWRKMPPAAAITRENLSMVRPLYVDAFEAVNEPKAPRKAGTHCDYCPARPVCPQAHALVREADTFSDADVVSAEEEVRRWDVCAHAEKTIKVFKAFVGARLDEDPDVYSGALIRGKGARVVTITDPAAVYNELLPDIGHEKLMTCSTFSITALSSVAIGGHPKVKKLSVAGEEMRATLESRLLPSIQETIRKGSIKRV